MESAGFYLTSRKTDGSIIPRKSSGISFCRSVPGWNTVNCLLTSGHIHVVLQYTLSKWPSKVGFRKNLCQNGKQNIIDYLSQ